MIKTLTIASLLALSTLSAPAAARGPCDACYWDSWHDSNGNIHWKWECPGIDAMLCDAPPPPPD